MQMYKLKLNVNQDNDKNHTNNPRNQQPNQLQYDINKSKRECVCINSGIELTYLDRANETELKLDLTSIRKL